MSKAGKSELRFLGCVYTFRRGSGGVGVERWGGGARSEVSHPPLRLQRGGDAWVSTAPAVAATTRTPLSVQVLTQYQILLVALFTGLHDQHLNFAVLFVRKVNRL